MSDSEFDKNFDWVYVKVKAKNRLLSFTWHTVKSEDFGGPPHTFK